MKFGYKFKDESLFILAMSHPSLSKQVSKPNYERLEFLGDRVLGLIIAEHLYKQFPYLPEGRLAVMQSKIVGRTILAEIARALDLGKEIIMDTGEYLNGGREKQSNLEDALEALIGAIYLDGGFNSARSFVLLNWKKYLAEDHANDISKDPKSELQEWAQKNGKPIPVYALINQVGPAHGPVFTIEVAVDGIESVRAEGASKKEAEIKAARIMVDIIRKAETC